MLGTIEEIKAKMDRNVLSLFDFLESDGKATWQTSWKAIS